MLVPVRVYRSLGVEGFGATCALVKQLGVRSEHVSEEVLMEDCGRGFVGGVLSEAQAACQGQDASLVKARRLNVILEDCNRRLY